METDYIKIPKTIQDELVLIFEFKRRYSELKKEQDNLFDDYQPIDITLERINAEIGEKLQYGKKLGEKNPEIEKLSNFKIKYLALYEEIKDAFLKYNQEIPSMAKLNYENLSRDIVYYFLDDWLHICGYKILDILGIKRIENYEGD